MIYRNSPRLLPIAGLIAAVFVVSPRASETGWQHLGPPGRTPVALETVATVSVSVDAALERQAIEGFGASHIALWYDGGVGDVLSGDLRARALDAVYGQARLTLGNVDTAILESPGGYEQRRNDNEDPFRADARGFQTAGVEAFQRLVLARAEAAAFVGAYPAQRINIRWASPWLAELRRTSYSRYLDEAAEQVLAGVRDWRDRYGASPRYVQLFNEPTSGNNELVDAGARDLVDLIKRVGARLRAEGFGGVQFVVPNEETVGRTLEMSREILEDPQARALVGAIAYHPYPYESPYANIPLLLELADQGRRDAASVADRRALKALATQHRLPLWMTEVSNGGVDVRSFDSLRGRAIHIHDELVEAGASAYFGMQNMWDLRSHEMHFGSKSGFYTHEGAAVVVDQDRDEVIVTGMGAAIGHYARWLSRGAMRLEARSGDDRVLVTAFRDDAQARLVLVAINNRRDATTLRVQLSGVSVGSLAGEQSTAEATWRAIDGVAGGAEFSLTVPALSVTTLAGSIDGAAAASRRARGAR